MSYNSILFQVSKLVILHEEAEDGNAMPDLARPIQVVKLAVDNLVKVSLYISIQFDFLSILVFWNVPACSDACPPGLSETYQPRKLLNIMLIAY